MAAARFSIDVVAKGQFVEAPDLLIVLRNTLEIIKNLGQAVSESHRIMGRWLISEASLQSPLHLTLSELSPPGGEVKTNESLALYVRGLQRMEADEPLEEPPPYFDAPTLVLAKRLSNAFERRVASVTFSVPEVGAVTITQRMGFNLTELMAARFKAKGALEGRLDTLTERGGGHFDIVDAATKDRIKCYTQTEDLMLQAQTEWRHRVAVYGQIKYDKNGKPISITAEAIRPLRPRENLPQPEDLRNVDITSGEESADYIRRLRDAE